MEASELISSWWRHKIMMSHPWLYWCRGELEHKEYRLRELS